MNCKSTLIPVRGVRKRRLSVGLSRKYLGTDPTEKE